MRVRLNSLYAGPLGCFGPGVCEVPDDIAHDLIRAEVAVAMPAAVETRDAARVPDPGVDLTEKMPPSRSGKRAKPAKSVVSDV